MNTSTATSDIGAAVGEVGSIFMLHPETFAGSIAVGYANPLAGYVAGRGGVLGETTGATVAAVFAIFEPTMTAALWDEGVAVRGAAGASSMYWGQLAARFSPAPRGSDASPNSVRRSSPRHRLPACPCSPAGAPCRWPRTPRPAPSR